MGADGAPGAALVVLLVLVLVKGEEFANVVALLDAPSLGAGAEVTPPLLGVELLFEANSFAMGFGTFLATVFCDSLLLSANEDAFVVSRSLTPSSVWAAFSLVCVEGDAGALEVACFDFSVSSVRGSGPALAAT